MSQRQTTRRLRVFFFLLFLASIGYFLCAYRPLSSQLSSPSSSTLPETFLSRPIYEYTSHYRRASSRSLEASLTASLLALVSPPLIQPRPTIFQLAPSSSLATAYLPWTTAWSSRNPSYTHILYTPLTASAAILPYYSSIPLIASTLSSRPELSTALLPYLLLYIHGGFYTSLPTDPLRALLDCPATLPISEEANGNISLILGVGKDSPYLSHASTLGRGWTRSSGFSDSTLWAPRPFSPILRLAIARMIAHAVSPPPRAYTQASKPRHEEEISGTGMLTDAVLDTLTATLPPQHSLRDGNAGLERRVSWRAFRALRNTLWVPEAGLAVLPLGVWESVDVRQFGGRSGKEEVCVAYEGGGDE